MTDYHTKPLSNSFARDDKDRLQIKRIYTEALSRLAPQLLMVLAMGEYEHAHLMKATKVLADEREVGQGIVFGLLQQAYPHKRREYFCADPRYRNRFNGEVHYMQEGQYDG